MKVFFSLLLFLLFTLPAHTKCAMSGVWCWPKSPTIRPNGILMIEFYANSQTLVDSLKSKYPLYLTSGADTIFLQITEVLKGQFELTQVILRPERQLANGRTYKLVNKGLAKEHHFIGQWDGAKKAFVPYSWTVAGEVDRLPPHWRQQPIYKAKHYIAYGCGPAEFVSFQSAQEDHSETLVRTTVKSLASGKSSTYYLTPDKGKLEVGHGMCSGAFTFGDGKDYEVTFALMDGSGNLGCDESAPLRFSRPESKDGGW